MQALKNTAHIVIVDDNIFVAKSVEDRLAGFDDLNVDLVSEGAQPILKYLEENNQIDLILMDVEMPEINGIELTQFIKSKYPHIKIIMLTVFDNAEAIFDAVKAGASGYLLKDISANDLHKGIVQTMNGGAAMSPSIAFKTLELLKNPIVKETSKNETFSLSKREKEVLELLSQGKTYKEIASVLYLSEGTIRKHVENTYKKLQVHNKVQALDKARRNRII
jgi:DNA-binding NarL/FixJ family response regulator